jgi:DNA repair protein RecO (recombination protein O)
MAKTYTIEGVVLNRRDYAEADRIITIFSYEKGKIVVLAKGARKLTSKRLGSLEIGTHLRAMVMVAKPWIF